MFTSSLAQKDTVLLSRVAWAPSKGRFAFQADCTMCSLNFDMITLSTEMPFNGLFNLDSRHLSSGHTPSVLR